MQFFKRRKRSGWAALRTGPDGATLAHVERRAGQKPVVTIWVNQPLNLQAASELKSFSDTYQLKQHHCVAVLGRADYQVMQLDAVKVPPAEVRQAIRWSIKNLLDYPVANATVDVLDIPSDPVNTSRQRLMLAIAARNEVIRLNVERLVDQAFAGLEAIDIPELGQRNIAALLEQPDRALALLSFNHEGGLLTFTAGGELYHARQLDVTLEQLQSIDEERRSHVYERVALDLQRSLDNFERQFPYVAVNRLLVAPFRMRDGFVDYLKTYLYLQVDTFALDEVFDLQQVPELADVEMQSRAFGVLGAALREEGP